MRKTSTLMAGVVAGVLATSAQASVIYNFHADPNSAKTDLAQVTGGRLEITDAAYQAGGIDVSYHQDPEHFGNSLTSPILDLALSIDPSGGPLGYGGFGIYPSSQQFADLGLPLSASLTFGDSGLLSGALDFRGVSDVAKARGTGHDWRVFDYGSDYFAPENVPCSGTDLCDIGTGYWQVDAATIPDPTDVPEPSTWVLFGLTVLGLFGATRRRMAR